MQGKIVLTVLSQKKKKNSRNTCFHLRDKEKPMFEVKIKHSYLCKCQYTKEYWININKDAELQTKSLIYLTRTL